MTSCGNQDKPLEKELVKPEDMRHASDRLTVEVDCPSLGSSECPSMSSSFSPLESPTPTPTSIYSQGSLASPSWHETGSYPGHSFDRTTGPAPVRGPFRLASMNSNENMALPHYSGMDPHERMPMPDFLSGYDDNVEQFWIPSDAPKTYEPGHQGLPYPPAMQQYPQMVRGSYRSHAPSYLPESATNPCLSRSIFHHSERVPTSMSMSNMLPWMPPPSESIAPQTIAPSQVAPVTPPPSYTDFPASMNNFKMHTPTTPVRSCSLGTASGTDTPMSRLSGGAADYMDDFQQSPVYADGMVPPHRQQSRKVARKQSSRQKMSLDALPHIIRQVQFKCQEPGCKGRFKRQEHLKRHMKSHSKEKPHVCWVPGCQRAFGRSDNLNAHYTKTHSKRGGRNRYVATLDETSPDFDPDFRGQLSQDGRPIYGSKLEDVIPDTREVSVDAWDD
ncbi:regulatory protein brlA [Aspergillus campestris IBT 28561]|uniref:C2H2 type master regulator of conidiophore development brlA n=1 Tax=Aspergillus campestris (strain IBT 28561) TaxID=1392248 RepID=A0A2I1DH97_ASPC2|nr:regulatory protein brlA [Aspergillus campestris IBT 28561]PKY09239.1 regulatory protein brlA [Aspergillus campestris IBT 28561]